eukprot:GHVN01077334.1.p1 GENE.GHVN01077334.1~~GHVN01077334.1.p1  ORF type:complete len:105 (-),score=21.23 GHVN01077334.1:2016-2330(-)
MADQPHSPYTGSTTNDPAQLTQRLNSLVRRVYIDSEVGEAMREIETSNPFSQTLVKLNACRESGQPIILLSNPSTRGVGRSPLILLLLFHSQPHSSRTTDNQGH